MNWIASVRDCRSFPAPGAEKKTGLTPLNPSGWTCAPDSLSGNAFIAVRQSYRPLFSRLIIVKSSYDAYPALVLPGSNAFTGAADW